MNSLTKPADRESLYSDAKADRGPQAWLDALAAGECDADTFLLAIAGFCQTTPDVAWEVLAWLDQYHRRGKIPRQLFQSLKLRIERYVLGAEGSADRQQEPFSLSRPAADRPGAGRTVGNAQQQEKDKVHAVSAPLRPPGSAPPAAVSSTTPARAVCAPPPGSAAPVADKAACLSESTVSGPGPGRALAVGDVLRGRYRLQALLGRGGMGTVYEALDQYRAELPAASQRLAVKVLHNEVSGRPNLLAELRREFQHSQALSHPNIVRVHEFDRDNDTAFFTMELLHGALLSGVLRQRHPQPLERAHALAIIRDVGAALVHAHSRDVVHGDLKPQNIFITGDGEVRVLDFGASHTLMREPWISDPESPPHFPVATPAYASCELLEGQRPDARDDLYALACVAYELLTGEHPFQSQTALDARALHLRPRRPSNLTRAQWQALRLGLAWERERRPPDVQGWLQQLDLPAAIQHLPLLHTLMATSAPRHRSPIGTALVLGVLLAVSAFWVTDDRQSLPRSAAALGLEVHDAVTRASARIASVLDEWMQRSAGESQPLSAPQSTAPTSANAAPASSILPRAPARVTASARTTPAVPPVQPAAPVQIALSADTYELSPADAVARVTVRRSGNFQGDLSFVWWTEAASAKAGDDFVSLGRRTEYIEAGKDSVSLLVSIVSDPARSEPKSFQVVIGEPGAGASLGALTRATVIIPSAQ